MTHLVCNWCADNIEVLLLSLNHWYWNLEWNHWYWNLESTTQQGNVCSELICSSKKCENLVYHQVCIEDHLRRLRKPIDRMTGFPCMMWVFEFWVLLNRITSCHINNRGHGRSAGKVDVCQGLIVGTRKIVYKNPEKKKKVLASALNPVQFRRQPPPPPPPREPSRALQRETPLTPTREPSRSLLRETPMMPTREPSRSLLRETPMTPTRKHESSSRGQVRFV
jgi:hypothetical protein